MPRSIAVVTGSRADFGLLRGILEQIRARSGMRLRLLVTGQHLSRRYGLTVREIERSGFPIAERIPMKLDSDRDAAMARAIADGVRGFARAFERSRPDFLVVLGDRFELLSACAAALPFRIPIAHIHGGEVTRGAIDEQIRHALTKLSHLHFPVAEQYRRRIIRMGEDPRRVHCFGAPGLDDLRRLRLLSRNAALGSVGAPEDHPLGLVTFHPATARPGSARPEIAELLAALDRFPDIFWLLTMPNAETESFHIIRAIRAFASRRAKRVKVVHSLGRLRYLSLMRAAAVVVGNSSSGLLETPSFSVPAVNVGDRQGGRLRTRNVIDVPRCDRRSVEAGIRRALSARFRAGLRGLKNPYAGHDSCRRIARVLERVPLGSEILVKGAA